MRGIFYRVMVAAVISVCVFSTGGCESLKKKFSRTKKKKNTETVVMVPRDYNAHPFSNEIMYKQYFAYWKSWNQELVSSLNDRLSHKKILDCADQALINLKKMSTYLVEEKEQALGVYVSRMEALRDTIAGQKTGGTAAQMDSARFDAERILSSVNRLYDSRKMKDYLKPTPGAALEPLASPESPATSEPPAASEPPVTSEPPAVSEPPAAPENAEVPAQPQP